MGETPGTRGRRSWVALLQLACTIAVGVAPLTGHARTVTPTQIEKLLAESGVSEVLGRYSWSGTKVSVDDVLLPGLKGLRQEITEAVKRLCKHHEARWSEDKMWIHFVPREQAHGDGARARLRLSNDKIVLQALPQRGREYAETMSPRSGKGVRRPGMIVVRLDKPPSKTAGQAPQEISLTGYRVGDARFGRRGLVAPAVFRRETREAPTQKGEAAVSGQVRFNGRVRSYGLTQQGQVRRVRRRASWW